MTIMRQNEVLKSRGKKSAEEGKFIKAVKEGDIWRILGDTGGGGGDEELDIHFPLSLLSVYRKLHI